MCVLVAGILAKFDAVVSPEKKINLDYFKDLFRNIYGSSQDSSTGAAMLALEAYLPLSQEDFSQYILPHDIIPRADYIACLFYYLYCQVMYNSKNGKCVDTTQRGIEKVKNLLKQA